MIYLDYAATSGRKPEAVYEASDRVMREVSGNPGRSGHKISLEAVRVYPRSQVIRPGSSR